MLSAVAPHAGAWIETLHVSNLSNLLSSLPMRERGLKRPFRFGSTDFTYVAPHAGAWIETSDITSEYWLNKMSLHMRERGLKQVFIMIMNY